MKRSISPLIATVLIIGFTIILAAMVMTWGQDLFRDTTEPEFKIYTEECAIEKNEEFLYMSEWAGRKVDDFSQLYESYECELIMKQRDYLDNKNDDFCIKLYNQIEYFEKEERRWFNTYENSGVINKEVCEEVEVDEMELCGCGGTRCNMITAKDIEEIWFEYIQKYCEPLRDCPKDYPMNEEIGNCCKDFGEGKAMECYTEPPILEWKCGDYIVRK